jgi:hypothetical protein
MYVCIYLFIYLKMKKKIHTKTILTIFTKAKPNGIKHKSHVKMQKSGCLIHLWVQIYPKITIKLLINEHMEFNCLITHTHTMQQLRKFVRLLRITHQLFVWDWPLGSMILLTPHSNKSYILKQTWWCLFVWTKIGQCLEDSFSHYPFPVELVTNRAGQGRAARAAVAGGRAKCHFY